MRTSWLLSAVFLTGCPSGEPEPSTEPIVPVAGEQAGEPISCGGSWQLPEELTGPDGLGFHGWTVEDLTLQPAWPYANRFESVWLSDNDDSAPSMRVRPWLVPEAGACYRDGVRAAMATPTTRLADALTNATGFSHRRLAYDGLERDLVLGGRDLTGGNPLYRALMGVHGLPNPFPGHPDAEDIDADWLLGRAATWPEDAQMALAGLVLAIGEAVDFKEQALRRGDVDDFADVHAGFLASYWGGQQNAFTALDDSVLESMKEQCDLLDQRRFNAAGLGIAAAVDEVLRVLPSVAPFTGGDIDLETEHGRIVLLAEGGDDVWEARGIDDVALIVDLGGDDVYAGRYAGTHAFWMSASVVVDLAGDDIYGPDVPDVRLPETSPVEAFDTEHGFTQGAGLLGVGVLADASGDDVYVASTHGQGAGSLGVGLLYDGGGFDDYTLGTHGQGMGYFGIGLLIDDGPEDDSYGIYTLGQGAGKPGGHGALIDAGGDDEYIAFFAPLDPWLPEPGYPNHYHYDGATWPYSANGTPHYMSCAQGVGWGLRGDWFSDTTNWSGGFGALIDLGDGDDLHYADDMSMGQGFVYGFGFLYDDGGDDVYRTFWWGPGASAHMGVGLFWEDAGDDDLHVAWASGGFGYDYGVAWNIDLGGNDTYGGQFNYGRGYSNATTVMLNVGGDDIYNAGEVRSDPMYGYVRDGISTQNYLGAFLDLGGGDDTYNTTADGVGNDAVWHHEAVGDANPARHKGIGIDR